MDKGNYLDEQQRIKLLVPLLLEMDLDGMVEAHNRAESIGPFLDPTLWIKKSGDFRIDQSVTKILRDAKNQILALIDEP